MLKCDRNPIIGSITRTLPQGSSIQASEYRPHMINGHSGAGVINIMLNDYFLKRELSHLISEDEDEVTRPVVLDENGRTFEGHGHFDPVGILCHKDSDVAGILVMEELVF